MKWINDEDISTLLELDKYLLCYESKYGSYCCQSEVMIGFTVDRWMETSKRQCKGKAISKFSPVNTSRLSIFWVSNSSECHWRPQTPFGKLRMPPKPPVPLAGNYLDSYRQINFLDQPLIGFWTWIWSTWHWGLGQEVACWFQCWKNSTGFIWQV